VIYLSSDIALGNVRECATNRIEVFRLVVISG
jgi:hypothetical protein